MMSGLSYTAPMCLQWVQAFSVLKARAGTMASSNDALGVLGRYVRL